MNFGIGPIRTGILNVADISVTFGVIILIVLEFLEDRKKGVREEKGSRGRKRE
jgi:lipoprotein signal peptidase